MRVFKTFLVLIISFSAAAQEGIMTENLVVSKHEVAFETGLSNRGMVAFTYGRNFLKGNRHYWSLHSSAGVGLYWRNGYIFPTANASGIGTISPALNIGSNGSFFTVGVEGKGMITKYDYTGLGLGAYVGYSYNASGGFSLKWRIGVVHWDSLPNDGPGFDFVPNRFPLPMTGLAIGWHFGDRL